MPKEIPSNQAFFKYLHGPALQWEEGKVDYKRFPTPKNCVTTSRALDVLLEGDRYSKVDAATVGRVWVYLDYIAQSSPNNELTKKFTNETESHAPQREALDSEDFGTALVIFDGLPNLEDISNNQKKKIRKALKKERNRREKAEKK